MDNKIFTESGELFLKEKMRICMDDLSRKILEEAPEEIDFFKKLIDYYIQISFPHNVETNLTYLEEEENYDIFESKLNTFDKDNVLKEDSNASKIYNELYHSLRSYTRAGLLGLYKHRDATEWYPKVILIENIGPRNDVDALDDVVIIYRGTGLSEFDSKIFSQAWTLDKNIAQEFAFVNYSRQPEYVNTSRVLIKAKISKNDIYFYDKTLCEQEAVINPSKIINNYVEIIEQKIIN